MAQAEFPLKLSGSFDVLYSLTNYAELKSEKEVQWDDYMPVWCNLPVAEFEDPMHLMEALFAKTPTYGPIPRLPRERDIIHFCPSIPGRGHLPSMLLMIVDLRGTCQPHLHRQNSVITTSENVKNFGLLMLKKSASRYPTPKNYGS